MFFPAALFLLTQTSFSSPTSVNGVCNVRDFGAVGDGHTMSTEAINAAVSACAAKGGGTVELPAGTWLTGTVYFQSHITMQLDAGAVLLGSPNLKDYPPLPHASEGRNTSLLVADGVKDISITGDGTIDGNSSAFVGVPQPSSGTWFDVERTRNPAGLRELLQHGTEGTLPMKDRPGVLLLALHSDGISLRAFRVRNSPNWGIKLMCSDHISVSDLDVRNSMSIGNTDALDVSNSSNALIQNSYLEAGDDALVVGGPCADGWCPERATQNVTVSNVILHSRSAAIRIGPNAAGARDFTFNNVIIYDSNRGIMVQARDAETIENLLFDNVSINTHFIDSPGWWGNGEPISITVAKWAYGSWNPPSPDVPNSGFGLIRHLRFSNVVATGTSPVILYSTAPGRIQDVAVSGLSITMQSSPLTPVLGGNLDLTPTTPQSDGLVRHNLSAILLHNVEDVSLDGTRVQWKGVFPNYYRSALSADGFNRLRIIDFVGTANAPGAPPIHLGSGTGAHLEDTPSSPKGTKR